MITTRRSRILEQRRHHRSRSFLTYDTGRSEGMTSFQTLPIELLNNTSDLLDKNELLNVRLINCRLRQAVEPRIGSLYFKEVRCLISKNSIERCKQTTSSLSVARFIKTLQLGIYRPWNISHLSILHPSWMDSVDYAAYEQDYVQAGGYDG